MSDIFREVDEAMQQDRAAKLWKTYGPVLVLGAIVLVLATGIVTAYRGWMTNRNQSETGKLVIAAESKDAAPALEKAAAEADNGHKTVALMNAASKLAEAKQFDRAAEVYNKVAEDKNAPSDLRDLATIYYVRAVMLRESEAKLDYRALVERLAPIARSEQAAFRLQARLDAALLYGDALKDYTAALDMLKGFDAEGVADSLKEKASALYHVYAYELSQSPAAATTTK